jgi:hypothetical protein
MPTTRQSAIQEIAVEIANAFPTTARFTSSDQLAAITVTIERRRSITIRFSTEAVRRYIAGDQQFRERARKAVRGVCASRLLDYDDHSPLNPFVIDAAMELSNPDISDPINNASQ